MTGAKHTYRAFGLTVRSDYELAEAGDEPLGEPDLRINNATTGNLSYQLNAISLMNLLAPQPVTAVVEIPPNFAIGVAQWLLSIAGALRTRAA